MPVFINKDRTQYAITSYKVAYSQFDAATDWKELGVHPTARIFVHAKLKNKVKKTFFLVRSPQDRLISCFKDKFRKQPTRIHEKNFQWQGCHQLLYPYLGVDINATDSEIAASFLNFTFDDFVAVLPKVYKLDVHFQPQVWSRKIFVGQKLFVNWPCCKIVRVEDTELLANIPSINWLIKRNATDHLEQDFELLQKHKSTIRTLYREDFIMGNYQF